MAQKPFKRAMFEALFNRLREGRRFIQVLAGPRQVGKTTLARQVLEESGLPSHYATADEPATRGPGWIEQQWEVGRSRAASGRSAVLVLDECQKVTGWSETVKRLWDEDTIERVPLHVVLLGSAPLLVQRGLSESLAGRFELIRLSHWSYAEMKYAFGWDADRYVFYGGYPGAAPLVEDPDRWARYISDSLIETSIARDVLLLTKVDKPALLRQLFRLACEYSGQVLSFQKMLGQLQDAGNTVTLAHYLQLLSGAGMVTGLQKFSGSKVRKRGSSPKLLALNTALISVTLGLNFEQARADPNVWGRLIESAAGAHLVNSSVDVNLEITYWRERNREVDYVVSRGANVTAIEVTSGKRKPSLPGVDALAKTQRLRRKLLIGGQGVPLEEFLSQPAAVWAR